ncbi:hypothetical protein EMCRGX_G017643 [Ephydatia muelleri]
MGERGLLLAARWFLAVSMTFALLRGCRALTPPGCPVIKDTPCLGDNTNVFIKGSTTAEVLAQLNSRFCGCTYITGSLSIQLSTGTALTEDSFNSLYYLKELSGSLQLNTIPSMSTITLPHLRIIRGQDTFSSSGGPVSLLVNGFTNGFLNLPSLTEISNGRAVFVSTSGTCGFLNVLWTDIFLSNGDLDYSMSGCTSPSSDCSSCPSGHCWSSGSLYCQNLTKTGCLQGCGRCFKSPEDGSYQCCSSLCAAGCYGSSSSQCYACSILNNNGSCVIECPPAQVYDPALYMLVNNPNYRLASGGLCVQQCTGNLLEYAGTCVTSCPVGYTSNGAKCVACSGGVCPRVCTGTDANGVVMGGNFTQFTSCTILNGSLAISDSSLTNNDLEVLSTIQEIQGFLRIESLSTLTSFPYLRNLKKIGYPGTAVNLSITGSRCQPGGPQWYSLVLRITSQLQSIDFSSLEVIQYGGYLLGGNPQLCYVGNFTRHLANTNLPVCLSASNSRGDPAACIAAGFVCHSQCASNSSCWGPNDTQCDGCRNFVYKGRCVAQCTDVVLSPGNSGIFQNNGSAVCEDCDSLCLGGCVNGTGPDHCIRCRNYTLVIQSGQLCVASCPLGTYANGTICTPCYHGCTAGCAGPLPYVNLTNGCPRCSYVQLDQQGQQVSCHISTCPQGTYPSTASSTKPPFSGTAQSLLSIVQDVSTWCLPCDDVCASCTGPGNTSCTTCRYAQRLAQCVSGCNNDTEYQNGDLYCHPCAAGCVGCTGPSISQCLKCASGSCASANLLQSSDIIGIVFGSIAAIFLATGAVLMLFIVYRRYEHKVFKIRAQSTAMYCNKGREVMINTNTLGCP